MGASAPRPAALTLVARFSIDPQRCWQTQLQALEAYIEANGDTRVPKRYANPDGTRLGRWVASQRVSYHAGKLKLEEKEALKEKDFIWDLAPIVWEEHFQQLQSYFHVHGHCRVPRIFEANPALGKWVWEQRRHYREGTIGAGRTAKLQDAGLRWAPGMEDWEAHFEALQVYKTVKGDCLVPLSFVEEDGTRLGTWVATQRSRLEKGEALAPGDSAAGEADRIGRLKEIGFVWAIVDGWAANFALLEAYVAEHGDCAVKRNFVASNGAKLGRWVVSQRRLRNSGKMLKTQVEKLEALGFDAQVERYASPRRRT